MEDRTMKKTRPARMTEDDWFEYRLENDPRFLTRIAKARGSVRSGKGIPWKDIEQEV